MSCKYGSCLNDAEIDGGGYCAAHQSDRAEAAEARAADLLEENRELSEALATAREERNQYKGECEGLRQYLHEAQEEMDNARRELNALKRELSEAFNSGDGTYRP